MRSYGAISFLCFGLICLFGLASIHVTSAAECGPEGSGLPRCNGTIQVAYSLPNCQGEASYYDQSESILPESVCVPQDIGDPDQYARLQYGACAFGVPVTQYQYYPTSSDRYGNCTQPFAATRSLYTVGACMNQLGLGNTSGAILCDITQTPFQTSTAITPGPVVLRSLGYDTCYAPDRCESLAYVTTYEGENCERSIKSTEVTEIGLKLDTCYDYRDGDASSPSLGNIMYSYDGALFHMKIFFNGCSGPTASSQSFRINQCFINASGQSVMVKMNTDTSTPLPQVGQPFSVSSSMHDSIQNSIFASLIVSFIAMLSFMIA